MKFLELVPNWEFFVTNTKTFAFTQINQCPLMLLLSRYIHCLLVYVVYKFINNLRCTTSVSDFNSRALPRWIFRYYFTSSGPCFLFFNRRYLGTKMTNMPVRLSASQYHAGSFFCHTKSPLICPLFYFKYLKTTSGLPCQKLFDLWLFNKILMISCMT